jgi:hypothetical protein
MCILNPSEILTEKFKLSSIVALSHLSFAIGVLRRGPEKRLVEPRVIVRIAARLDKREGLAVLIDAVLIDHVGDTIEQDNQRFPQWRFPNRR